LQRDYDSQLIVNGIYYEKYIKFMLKKVNNFNYLPRLKIQIAKNLIIFIGIFNIILIFCTYNFQSDQEIMKIKFYKFIKFYYKLLIFKYF